MSVLQRDSLGGLTSGSYIIDAYEQLPDVIVFMHGARYQWHNDHPVYGTGEGDYNSPLSITAC